jgi:16S rRNA processing protein RimM
VKRDLVSVGVITGAHGIKGEVKLRSFTAEPAAIASYSPLGTAAGGKIEIAKLRAQKDGFIATLKGVGDRNAAEALRGTELFVPRKHLAEPEEGEVYLGDLVGLAVYQGEARLGEVVGVENFGASDLLDVALDGRAGTVYIPYAESFIAAVEDDRVVVTLPEGFLDEGARP